MKIICCSLQTLQQNCLKFYFNYSYQMRKFRLINIRLLFITLEVHIINITQKSKSDYRMNNFKGLIPKNIIGDESMKSLVNKTEQFRKITQQATQITTSHLKIYQIYLHQLPRLMGLLQDTNLDKDFGYYTDLRQTYTQIYKQYQTFIIDSLQNPSNQISNSNSLKFINFSGFLLTFQQQVKNYTNSQNSALEMAKKYFKSQKSLFTSIQAYKQSFYEAKLIYNMQQKIKRYSTCQQNYKTVAQDHGVVMQMREKLQEKKKQIAASFENLKKQMGVYQNQIDLKIFRFLAYFNINFCQNIRKRLDITKSAKKRLDKSNIKNFFNNFNLQQYEQNQKDKQNSEKSRRKAGLQGVLKKQQINKDQLRKLVIKLQKYIDSKKQEHLKIYDFHVQFFKTAQKKCVGQLKQALTNFQKNKKKIKQQFVRPCYEQLKKSLKLVRITMQIYNEVQKKIGNKIQSAGQYIQEFKTILKGLTQQVSIQIQKTIQQMKDKQVLDSQIYKQKLNAIYGLIKVADQKLTRDFVHLKPIYNEILHLYQLSLVQAYENCRNIGKQTAEDFDKSEAQIKNQKIQRLKYTPFNELLSQQNKVGITFQDEAEKNNDFKKLKKPVEIQVSNKQKEGSLCTKQQIQKQQYLNDGEQRPDESPLKDKKKHRQFLQTKFNFVEGEQLLRTFSCALADKIILQGRLYVTSHRVCFFSKFNPSTVFFGGTFIQIPKKDIITLQKRKNGIFFDNSISLTTINGEVFLTSFFKRNEAFSVISKQIGINKEEQAYEQDGVFQSDTSSMVDKAEKNDNAVIESPQEQIQIKAAQDDIKQEEISDRAVQIQKMLDQLKFSFKQVAHGQFNVKGMTAYRILQFLMLDHEITISGKKYKNFNEYYKKITLQHKDIEVTSFQPAVKQHLNPNNIKSTCPTKLTRKINSTVPTPPSNIPFMPKSAKTMQNQSLYIYSKHKWVLDTQLQNSGAPYTDCFKVYFRTICESTGDSCKIVSKMFVNFHKNTMMKGIIESKTQQQSGLQLKKQYDDLKKYILSQQKQKSKKLKLLTLSKTQSCAQTGKTVSNQQVIDDEENEKVKQLQQRINEIQQKHQLTLKSLQKQIGKYQKILAGVLALYLLSLLVWIF